MDDAKLASVDTALAHEQWFSHCHYLRTNHLNHWFWQILKKVVNLILFLSPKFTAEVALNTLCDGHMSGSVLMYFQKVHDTLNLVILRIRTFKVSRGWEFDSPQELCFLDYYGRAHSLRHILAVWATSFVDPLTHTQAQPQLGWWMMWFAHTANNHILVQTCNHKIKNGEVLCYELSYSACIDCGALMRSNIRIQLCVTTRWPEVPALLSILTLVLRWLISSFFPDIIYPGFTKTSLFLSRRMLLLLAHAWWWWWVYDDSL